MITLNSEEYLQPSELCDFDRCPELRAKALELTLGCQSMMETFQHIFAFVKALPYGLEDWDVTASETLAKGWGMCSGKTNLLVALLRSLAIPTRYRIYRIRAEVGLWTWVTGEEEMSRLLGTAPLEQDHVDCEVCFGGWSSCDPARDESLERGMVTLGIPLEREPVTDASGRVPYLILTSLDDWAKKRQEKRRFRENRSETFARVNEHLWRIRALGWVEGEHGGSDG